MDGSFPTVRVELDTRLSPAANAQRYYKKYNKTKTAKVELARQIELGEAELSYLYTVFESLTRAESPEDPTQAMAHFEENGTLYVVLRRQKAGSAAGYSRHRLQSRTY